MCFLCDLRPDWRRKSSHTALRKGTSESPRLRSGKLKVEGGVRCRCHQIMNCAKVCPKGLNPGKSIAKIKQ